MTAEPVSKSVESEHGAFVTVPREPTDERLKWFLTIIEAAGGTAPAGDSFNLMNAFCDDQGDGDDTYNVSESAGFTRTIHSGWGDGCATVEITETGKRKLSVLAAPKPPEPVVRMDREAVFAPLAREPLAAITSLDGKVREPLICLTVAERDAIIALASQPDSKENP